MKSKSCILFLIISVIFFIFMYFTGIQIVSNNDLFFKKFFEKYDIYDRRGVSVDDSVYVIDILVDYMEGKSDTLKLNRNVLGFDKFSSRETLHMIDVRNIYIIFRTLRDISCILYIISLVLYKRKTNNNKIFKYSIISFIIANVIFLGSSLMILFNFDEFWFEFHKIAFTNDLWLLNPSNDLMINVCSNEMFKTLIINSFIVYIIISVIYLMGVFIYKKAMLTKNT